MRLLVSHQLPVSNFWAACYLIIAYDSKMGCYRPHFYTLCTALSKLNTVFACIKMQKSCVYLHQCNKTSINYKMVWKDQDTLIEQSMSKWDNE